VRKYSCRLVNPASDLCHLPRLCAFLQVFDPKAEHAFKYLQVFSAICVVFAHGAGEVGYMAGPLAAIWSAYTEGVVPSKITAPVWVTFIGAFGLVIGLATYGYNVTRAMGVRLSKMTATRGFCAELATATVILVASQYGLPTSSSQCITGGIIGVGLAEGKNGVNWRFFAIQFTSWVSTLFIAGLFTAALFSQGVFAPSIPQGNTIIYYENSISTTAGVSEFLTLLARVSFFQAPHSLGFLLFGLAQLPSLCP
jgi:solute carrier family 20 (sodium-dependent phosphate transporter)